MERATRHPVDRRYAAGLERAGRSFHGWLDYAESGYVNLGAVLYFLRHGRQPGRPARVHAADGIVVGMLQPAGHGADLAGADRVVVDVRHRADLGTGPEEEDFARQIELGA